MDLTLHLTYSRVAHIGLSARVFVQDDAVRIYICRFQAHAITQMDHPALWPACTVCVVQPDFRTYLFH